MNQSFLMYQFNLENEDLTIKWQKNIFPIQTKAFLIGFAKNARQQKTD